MHLTESGTMDYRMCVRHDIKSHVSAPHRPNENPEKGKIRQIKKKWYRIQAKTNAPDRVWDYGISYVCETDYRRND